MNFKSKILFSIVFCHFLFVIFCQDTRNDTNLGKKENKVETDDQISPFWKDASVVMFYSSIILVLIGFCIAVIYYRKENTELDDSEFKQKRLLLVFNVYLCAMLLYIFAVFQTLTQASDSICLNTIGSLVIYFLLAKFMYIFFINLHYFLYFAFEFYRKKLGYWVLLIGYLSPLLLVLIGAETAFCHSDRAWHRFTAVLIIFMSICVLASFFLILDDYVKNQSRDNFFNHKFWPQTFNFVSLIFSGGWIVESYSKRQNGYIWLLFAVIEQIFFTLNQYVMYRTTTNEQTINVTTKDKGDNNPINIVEVHKGSSNLYIDATGSQ